MGTWLFGGTCNHIGLMGIPLIMKTYSASGLKYSFLGITLKTINFQDRTSPLEYNAHGFYKKNKIDIHPAFAGNCINIAFNCDDKFVPYLCVAIKSIVATASTENNYDILILTEGLSPANLKWIDGIKHAKNVSLRVVNVRDYLQDKDISSFFMRSMVSRIAYVRLYLGELLEKYAKVLYLDCDLIAQSDVAELFNMNLDGNVCAAVPDLAISTETIKNVAAYRDIDVYLRDVLGVTDISQYFNSGVMVFDLEKIRTDNLQQTFIAAAAKNTKFFMDQNVLNSALYGKVLLLGFEWNKRVSLAMANRDTTTESKILHFAAEPKPLQKIHMPEHYNWWEYARQLPFYEELLSRVIKPSSTNFSSTSQKLPSLNKFIYRKYIKPITALNNLLKFLKIVD